MSRRFREGSEKVLFEKILCLGAIKCEFCEAKFKGRYGEGAFGLDEKVTRSRFFLFNSNLLRVCESKVWNLRHFKVEKRS